MCGIAGYLCLDADRPAAALSERLSAMTDALAHRGPDGHGALLEGPVALGHRRLAIIDLATGEQPMTSWDGGLVISFNGEIYNHVELRAELERRGHRFRTRSDTEVILEAYRAFGTRCVEHLNGMWAFALWDRGQQVLFCSRDRAGEKPLFWALHDGCFVFGSEIKALAAFGVPRQLDRSLLDTYLSLTYVPAPRSFYSGIAKLPPASSLRIAAGDKAPSVTRYWTPAIAGVEHGRTDTPAILDEFTALFRDAVRIRMRSDVPVGAFLSGGLDSGSVVSAMHGAQTRTFTIGFGDSAYDERALAKQVALRFGTLHVEREVTPEDASALLGTIARAYDEPFGDSSALPTLAVSRVAREQVKVVLTGDGGDEVLGGYAIHLGEWVGRAATKLPLLPELVQPALSALAPHAPMGGKLERASRALRLAGRPFVERLEAKQSGLGQELRRRLLASQNDVQPVREAIEDALLPVRGRDTMAQLDHWLFHVSLPDDMLTKVDRASMAVSLEARVPFLDHRLIELLLSVSPAVKLGGLKRKRILRDTIGKDLPPPLLDAPKRGFGVPLETWLAAGAGEFLSRRARICAEAGLIDGGALERWLAANQGRASGVALWVLAMLSYAVA